VQPPGGIVAQASLQRAGVTQRGAGAVGLDALFDEAVLDVVKIDARAVGGEVAVAIVAERGAAGGGVLVEAVGGVGAGERGLRG
jgi:hypothetical protein